MKNDSSRGTNGVRHDVVHRLYQDVLYCQNFVWFHGTRVNVIIYPHKPSRASHVAILTKLSYNLLYRISPNSDNTRKKKKWTEIHVRPVSKGWFSFRLFQRTSQSLNQSCGSLPSPVLSKSKEKSIGNRAIFSFFFFFFFFFFFLPLSISFPTPIFTHLVTAKRYYVHNCCVECHQNRPDMESTDRNSFTTFSEVWLTRPIFTKLMPAVLLVIRICSTEFHGNTTNSLIAHNLPQIHGWTGSLSGDFILLGWEHLK